MDSREIKKAKTSSANHHQSEEVGVVNVESIERGFLINVYLEKNSPGLLVTILETFEKLGLEVLDANVSCSDCFELEAIGEQNEGNKTLNPQMVKKAVKQAIKEWSENNGQS